MAGPDRKIFSFEQFYTVIAGTAADADGDSLQYRWLEGDTVLQGWRAVGATGAAPLHLAAVPPLSRGLHTLRLEVTDGILTVSDCMDLVVNHSPRSWWRTALGWLVTAWSLWAGIPRPW